MILIIIACSLIGSVTLIGVCDPLFATFFPTILPKDYQPSTVIVEPFRHNWNFNANREGIALVENIEKDAIKDDFQKWIAIRSVPILHSWGMTNEEIKSELMRDFALTEEQVDEILAAQ